MIYYFLEFSGNIAIVGSRGIEPRPTKVGTHQKPPRLYAAANLCQSPKLEHATISPYDMLQAYNLSVTQ
nr:MAG: hypothetical protein [Bacteriophage sp.]